MAVTKTWKVWGAEGHRQKLSFGESIRWDFTKYGETRVIEVEAEDKTGTNDYVIVSITRETAEECEREFAGQLDDGLFEDAQYGKIEEMTVEELKSERVGRIKRLVKRCGTQRELAQHFGIPLRTVETWCQGRSQCPGYVVRMITQILDFEEQLSIERIVYLVGGIKKGRVTEYGYCFDKDEALALAESKANSQIDMEKIHVSGYKVKMALGQSAKEVMDDMLERECEGRPLPLIGTYHKEFDVCGTKKSS